MNTVMLLAVFTSLVFSFFFSGIELAFLSANKLHIELKRQEGSTAGKIAAYFLTRPSWFIATTLVGNSISIAMCGMMSTKLLATKVFSYLPYHGNTFFILVICIVLITLALLFVNEFLSKNLFLINPNQIIYALSIPILIAFIILFPITAFVVYFSKFFVTTVLRLEYSETKPVFGLTDLGDYLKSKHSVKHEDEDITLDTKIFHNALEFKTVRIRECMIPRTEIIAINQEEGIQNLTQTFIESGHSKIIVFRETIDDVIGYCHSSALFKKPKRIEEILTPIIMVPETMLANELMVRFIGQRKSLALVVDEFGGTSGLVSMENVIEKIFGEIEDEHDAVDLLEQKIDENTFLLSGRLTIGHLNQTHKWSLPEGDYETLAGLILSFTKKIPQVGEVIIVEEYIFTIHSTQENRIDTLKMAIATGS